MTKDKIPSLEEQGRAIYHPFNPATEWDKIKERIKERT